MFKPLLIILTLLSFVNSVNAADVKYENGVLHDKIYAPFIEYKLYVPNSVNKKSKNNKLLVMLHGCEQTPREFFEGSKIREHADKNGFIVLLPQQSEIANPYRCWNWFNPMNQIKTTMFLMPNEPFNIASMIDSVSLMFRIKGRESVFIAGMSAGAAMANIVTSCYPEKIGGVAMHHGVAYGAANLSLIDMEALEILFQEGSGIDARASAQGAMSCATTLNNPRNIIDKVVPSIIFQGADGYMTYDHAIKLEEQFKRYNVRLGASKSYKTTASSVSGESEYDYERYLTYNQNGELIVERYKVHGLGHAWSGGVDSMEFFDSKGPDATSAMIKFFKRYGL